MDSEKFKVKLDSPENVYFSGQEIKGKITLILNKRTKIRGIYYRIQGYGKCCWCEFLRRESSITNEKETQRPMVYTARENYLLHKEYIMGSKSRNAVELESGSYTFDFVYNLGTNLPSTFKGSYGSIKYKIEFFVEKAWNFDDKYTMPITIVRANPLTVFNFSVPVLKQRTKSVGVFGGAFRGGQPVTLVAELPQDNVVRGKNFSLKVSVNNRSNTHIEKLKFSIRQLVTYFSHHPLPYVKREETNKLFKKETGSIEKKSDRLFEYELPSPLCQPTDDSCSKIINLRYEVQVDLVLPGMYKNLTINLPIIICSHEPTTERSQSITIGNSVLAGVLPAVYPDLNTSIASISSSNNFNNSSPSHSIASVNSSFQSPSTSAASTDDRSSISSYPLAHMVPDEAPDRMSMRSLEYVLAANVRTSDGVSQRNSYMSLETSAPPSYDELFGNATAPPIDVLNK